MKLEQQVVSLELAKRLKELGVKQESMVYFAHEGKLRLDASLYESYLEDRNDRDMPFRGKYASWLKEVNGGEIYSALTVAELGEMLPEEIEINEQSYWLEFGRTLGRLHLVGYRKNGTHDTYFEHTDDTEANARAKLLIYLLESKLINL